MPGLCRPQVQLMSLSRSRAERRSCRGCAGRLQFGRGKATGRPVPIGRECPVLWIADAKADVAKSTRLVESRCGAVALGRTYLLPPLSSGGALVVQPWLRFHIPLIEPDMRISRIRLSDKNSCFRVQRLLQFLTSFRS